MDFQTRLATKSDYLGISICLDTAFMKPQANNVVNALRGQGAFLYELVAEADGVILGYLGVMRMETPANWGHLWPLSISPINQGKGYGKALVRAATDMARARKLDAVLVTSQPKYFSPMFSGPAAQNIDGPVAPEHMALYAIAPGTALSAPTIVFPSAFSPAST